MGLLGNGGIHAHTDHLIALIKFAADQKIDRLYLHLFTDGIDAPPQSSTIFLEEVEKAIEEHRVGQIATIMGRDFAMDRDGRWEKTSQAYAAMVHAKGEPGRSAKEALEQAHDNKIGDEKIPPTILQDSKRGTRRAD